MMVAEVLPIINTGFVSNKENKKPPFVLDESIPRTCKPKVVDGDKIWKDMLESAKNKPNGERTLVDYMLLANDAMNPCICYIA